MRDIQTFVINPILLRFLNTTLTPLVSRDRVRNIPYLRGPILCERAVREVVPCVASVREMDAPCKSENTGNMSSKTVERLLSAAVIRKVFPCTADFLPASNLDRRL